MTHCTETETKSLMLQNEELKAELSNAYAEIARLTNLLDRAFGIIEDSLAKNGETSVDAKTIVEKETAGKRRLDYVTVDDVCDIFGCSRATASKRMKKAGAASIGSKLVCKRSSILDYHILG